MEQLLDGVLEEHCRETSKGRGCLHGRNEVVWRLYLKARLVTLAYPNATEGLLLARAADSSLPLQLRGFAITMLGELYRTGRTNLEGTLLAIATGPEPALATRALRELSAVDATGRFLDLYRSQCRAQSWDAFDAVSDWYDPVTIKHMERLIADSPGNPWPECSLRLSAENVLARLQILASPDCDATLSQILDGSRDSHHFDWALQVARKKSMPGLLAALRVRLDRVQAPPSPGASEAEKYDYARMERDGGGPVQKVVDGRYIGDDVNFDDVLLAYAQLGGELNDAERRRLTLFGYLGDPMKRLDEMLKEKE